MDSFTVLQSRLEVTVHPAIPIEFPPLVEGLMIQCRIPCAKSGAWGSASLARGELVIYMYTQSQVVHCQITITETYRFFPDTGRLVRTRGKTPTIICNLGCQHSCSRPRRGDCCLYTCRYARTRSYVCLIRSGSVYHKSRQMIRPNENLGY